MPKKDWSEDYVYCRSCYSTDYKHAYFGYCQKCYDDMDVKIEVTKTLRKCLKCDTEFYSKGIANRRCDVCVRKEQNSSSKPKDRYKISINLH